MGLGGVFAAADRRYRRLAATRRRGGGQSRRRLSSTWENHESQSFSYRCCCSSASPASSPSASPSTREVPSPLIDKPAPNPPRRLDQPEQTFALGEMRGRSGCSTCGPRGAWPAARSTRCWYAWPRRSWCRWSASTTKEVRGDGAISTRGMALEAETTMAIRRARRWLADHGNLPALGARHRRPRRHRLRRVWRAETFP